MLTLWILYGVLFVLIAFVGTRYTITFRSVNLDFDSKFKYLLILGIILLMTSNRTGFDARSYQRFFSNTVSTNIPPMDYSYLGYFYLIRFFLHFFPSINYYYFHASILFLGWTFLIIPAMKKYCCSTCALISLYTIIGVFASDGMQMKNFIAVNFLIAAIVILFEEKKYSLIYFAVLLSIAVIFHFSFIIYAFIPLVNMNNSEKKRLAFPIIGSIGYFIFLTGQFNGLEFLINRLSSLIPILSKVAKYASSTTGIKSIVPVFIYFLIWLVLEYSNINNLFPDDKSILMKKTIIMWNFMGILLPLLNIANASYRIYRNVYLLIFAFLVNVIMNKKIEIKKRFFVLLFTLVIGFMIFYHICLLHQDVDIYLPVLEGTMFWEKY